MAASYPTSIKTWTPVADNVDEVLAAHVNDLYDEVISLETYNSVSGWIPALATWSYSSADDPTFVISVNADMTGTISVGQRLKFTQTTVKYAIVTVVGAYSGGVTLITIYGGTDYDLVDAAITDVSYSCVKAPFGFPLDPSKWTQVTTRTSDFNQASPTANQWYNVSSLSIPIGVWKIKYEMIAFGTRSSAGDIQLRATLSTTNNGETSAGFTSLVLSNSIANYACNISRANKLLSLASKTTYYLNLTFYAAGGSSLQSPCSVSTLFIEAECAYL